MNVPTCNCITAEQIGVGVPVSEAVKIADEWRQDCPVHGKGLPRQAACSDCGESFEQVSQFVTRCTPCIFRRL